MTLRVCSKRYLPKIKIIEGAGTDYPYRAKVSHKALANAVKKMVLDIDYGHFKKVVAGEQSFGEVHGIWSGVECFDFSSTVTIRSLPANPHGCWTVFSNGQKCSATGSAIFC